jgi:hypothetical protein
LQLTLSHLVQTFRRGTAARVGVVSRHSFIQSEVTQAFHHRHSLIIRVAAIQTAMPQAGRSSQLGLRHRGSANHPLRRLQKPVGEHSTGACMRAALSVSCRLFRGCASAATDADPGRVPTLLAALASCHGGKYLPSPPPTVNLPVREPAAVPYEKRGLEPQCRLHDIHRSIRNLRH